MIVLTTEQVVKLANFRDRARYLSYTDTGPLYVDIMGRTVEVTCDGDWYTHFNAPDWKVILQMDIHESGFAVFSQEFGEGDQDAFERDFVLMKMADVK